MFIRTFIFLIVTIFLVQCEENNKPKVDCSLIIVPNDIIELGLEQLFKEAKWQIYKYNLLKTDSFAVKNPYYMDTIYSETSLSEFDLELFELEQRGDTTAFTLFFERGVSPLNTHYYYTASFWGDKDKVELSGRFGFIFNKQDYSNEFKNYLISNKEKLSSDLKCLAIEREIFKYGELKSD